MNQAILEANRPAGYEDLAPYRELSKSAVLAVVFGALGLFSFLHPVFLVLPLLGILFGGLSLLAIRRYPEELAGFGAALTGLVISAVTAVAAVGSHTWAYATEVPEGHVRIGFADLAPNPRLLLPWAQRAEELDGKKVFIKGFVRLDKRRTNLKNFLLVGDFGSCCFGGSPKITQVVAVSILGDATTSHSYLPRRVTGTFRLNRETALTDSSDVPQVYYVIEADEVR